MSAAIAIAIALLGVFMLIVLHELGHFFAAKATGMRVEQLSLFFGPKLVRIRRGETEYCIGTIPLGGYAKITGMTPREELDPEVAPRAYYRQPVWKRIVVILAGPAVNVAFAFIVLFGAAFSLEKPTALDVASVEAESPAERHLEPGDVIVAVDGRRAEDLGLGGRAAMFAQRTDAHECVGGRERDGCRAAEPVELTIERGGARRELAVRPYYDSETARNRLGFSFGAARYVDVNPSIAGAAEISLETMWEVTSATLSIFARIFDAEEREKLGSLVGAVEVTRQAIQLDADLAFRMIGLVSLSLALINLFPFLPLDGGHVFWSLVEKVRGRRVPFEVMERASVIGVVLVLVIFYIGFTNDLERFANGEFDVE